MGDLDQIARDAAGFRGRFAAVPSCRDNYAEGEMALTYTSDGSDEPMEIANEIQGGHIAAPLARMLNAVPALLSEVEMLRTRLAEAKQEISDIRGALDAHGHDGTFEAAARMRDFVSRLRSEVDRLRNLGRISRGARSGKRAATELLAEINRKVAP